MATPEITVESDGDRRPEAACSCTDVRMGRARGLTLLGAAILVPAVVYYLSKHLWERQTATRAPRRRKTAAEPATQRITIPIRVVSPTGEEHDAATLRVPEEPAAAVEVVATQADMPPFVGSIESDKFHVPGCRWAQNIEATNRVSFPSREVAVAQGYVACNTCKP